MHFNKTSFDSIIGAHFWIIIHNNIYANIMCYDDIGIGLIQAFASEIDSILCELS